VACWQVNTACWSRESQLCPAGVPGVPRRVVQARDAAGMGSRLCGAGGVARRAGAAQPGYRAGPFPPGGGDVARAEHLVADLLGGRSGRCESLPARDQSVLRKLQRERPGPAAVSSTRIFPAFCGPGLAPSPSATESARAGETGGTCRPAPTATATHMRRQITLTRPEEGARWPGRTGNRSLKGPGRG